MGWTQTELDVAEVMIWMRSNHGREISYADISAGVQITNPHRLRRAVRVVRVIAANRGDRLDRFQPSADPARRDSARRRVWVTRYMRHGHGDEFSARDAMSAARAAMTSVKDMHRATTFEADNAHSIARKEFATMAQAADECITRVAGIDKLGPQTVRQENNSLLA
jgi:predicted P-loop ATPase